MENQEKRQDPVISLFSMDLQIPSEPACRAVGKAMLKREKTSQTGD